MALTVRKTPDALVFALVQAWNRKQEASVASFFHADVTQITTGDYQSPTITNDTVTAANGTDLATNITLVNNMKAVMNRHFVDPRAHNTAVTTAVTTANATDQATAITLANALKAAYNTGGHINASNVHFTNDGTNTISAANATDLATLQTLNNEMKGDFNAHVISAPLGEQLNVVDA